MNIHLLTLFPSFFLGPLEESLLKKARNQGIIQIQVHDIRDFTTDKHKTADDTPYGGGIGMVLKIEPIQRALEAIHKETVGKQVRTVLLTPTGRVFFQQEARSLSKTDALILICGRYEGVDDRIETLITDKISLGDFVLTGGEAAALALIEATIRFLPGVIGKEQAPYEDSFSEGLLEFPQYTKPEVWKDQAVPAVLLSGNHQAIARWRRKESLRRTLLDRSDLFSQSTVNQIDQTLLQEIIEQTGRGEN